VSEPSQSNTVIAAFQRNPLAPSGDASLASARLMLVAARRWWKYAFPLGVVFAALGAGVVFVHFEPEYEAVAWLRVHERAPFIAFQGGDDSRLFVENLKELIRSRLLLSSVASDPSVAEMRELVRVVDPVDELSRRVSVSAVGRSEYFAVGFRSLTPDGAALTANTVAAAYISLQNTDERERRSDVLDLLEREKEHHERAVSRLQTELKEKTRNTAGEGGPAPRHKGDEPDERLLDDLQRRMVNVNVERAVLQAEFDALKQRNPEIDLDVAPESQVEQYVETHPEIQRLQSELDARQTQIQAYKAATNSNYDLSKDASYQQLQKSVGDQLQKLDDLRDNLRSRFLNDAGRQVAAQRREAAAAMESKLRSYEITHTELQKQFVAELSKTKQQSGDSLQIEFLRADLDQATQVFSRISERMLQLKTELRAPDRVVLVEQAVAPALPVERVPYKQLALVAIGLFAAPFALAVSWERLLGRVGESQQLEKQSQLRVVGEIVKLPWRRRRRRTPKMHTREASCLLYEESIDSLRTSILLSQPLEGVQVLAVTSAVSKEGKTSLATQYAVSVARATREKVLLIDGDLRRPDIHRVFGVQISPGLAEVLTGTVTLDEAIETQWSEFLHLLPAGKVTDSPHRLLGNGAFQAVLERARAKYQHIVIDTPPVLAVGESLVLARSADAAILCTMRDVSRLNQVRTAHQRLVDAGARPVGAVLGGVPPSNYRFRYGGYQLEV